MADKGIIFSAPMVRALLAGTKTQTRRLITPCPWPEDREPPYVAPYAEGARAVYIDPFDDAVRLAAPYAVGDRLYVREAWHAARSLDSTAPRDIPRDADIEHAATARSYAEIGLKGRLRPGMHMPRWASRLWLEVTEVRVQRLQDISAADAIAEGLIHVPGIIEPNWWRLPEPLHQGTWLSPVAAYAFLWGTLHTEPGQRWGDNPWIVAVSFTVHHGNIDEGRA